MALFVLRFLLYLLLALWAIFFTIRYLCNRTSPGRGVIIKLLISLSISGIAATQVLLVPSLWWLQAVVVFSTLCNFLLIYLITDQILNNTPPQSVIKHRLFPIIILISSLSFLFVFLERDALLRFLEHKQSWLPWEHYAYYLTKDSFEVFLIILIIKLYWQNLHQHYAVLTYFVRRWICILAYLLTIGYIFSLDYPLITTLILGRPEYVGIQFEWIFQDLSFFLLAVGFMTPNKVFSIALRPFDRLLKRRHLRNSYLLRFLHKQILCIVPDINLSLESEPLKYVRVLIEIRDARQIIWSNIQCTTPLTPQLEAKHLHYLIKGKTVFHEIGPHHPPKILRRNVLQHDIAVAKQLMILQNREPVVHESVQNKIQV